MQSGTTLNTMKHSSAVLAPEPREEMVVRKFLLYAGTRAKCLKVLVGRGGFEPPTNGLKVLLRVNVALANQRLAAVSMRRLQF
jgi:hypothetical protein